MGRGNLLHLLARYGQRVTVERDGALEVVRAFLQPVLERREDWTQREPTPLGTVRRDQFLYIGPAGVSPEGAVLECRGTRYEAQAAQLIFVGDEASHWWAVLRVRDAEGELRWTGDNPSVTARP